MISRRPSRLWFATRWDEEAPGALAPPLLRRRCQSQKTCRKSIRWWHRFNNVTKNGRSLGVEEPPKFSGRTMTTGGKEGQSRIPETKTNASSRRYGWLSLLCNHRRRCCDSSGLRLKIDRLGITRSAEETVATTGTTFGEGSRPPMPIRGGWVARAFDGTLIDIVSQGVRLLSCTAG